MAIYAQLLITSMQPWKFTQLSTRQNVAEAPISQKS